jgi:hypothetical protein
VFAGDGLQMWGLCLLDWHSRERFAGSHVCDVGGCVSPMNIGERGSQVSIRIHLVSHSPCLAFTLSLKFLVVIFSQIRRKDASLSCRTTSFSRYHVCSLLVSCAYCGIGQCPRCGAFVDSPSSYVHQHLQVPPVLVSHPRTRVL